jgi:hypothetical protein
MQSNSIFEKMRMRGNDAWGVLLGRVIVFVDVCVGW